jgi:SAM-dependent methyltransferase
MGQHYGEDYDRAISRTGQNPGFWTRRRATLLRYVSSGAILDLGCSSGGFLASLKGPEWKLFGIEMSERVAREAEARTGAQVFVGDILDAPFPQESFDAITCFHVFEHVYQPKELLAKVREWLRPGGIFYTEMPNIDSAGARIFRSYWYGLELPRHLFHFSPATLRNLARSAGLEELSITTQGHVFIETSVRYIFDDIARKFGIRPTPLAQAKPASLAWRVVRKGFRMGVLPVLNWLASFAGDRGSIHALFRKG